MLFLAPSSEDNVRSVLISLGIKPKLVRTQMHLSVYHARRRLVGLSSYEEAANVEADPLDWRLMAMTPGGENPRSDVDPALVALGIRLKRSSSATPAVRLLRSRFYELETTEVLGIRTPSNHSRSAFGSHHFQPHVTLVRPGNGVERDLSKLGDAFRAAISPIRFDRFVVSCR